jgi:phosphoribosylamine--glycine ligase
MDEVIMPTVNGMASEGNDYVGFLYAGLMIMADGTPKVIEYNCRFGDPETQPIMLRLQSDLVPLCQAACKGELAGKTIAFDDRAAVGVVLAAGGYPGSYDKGDEITGFEEAEKLEGKVFHAGTALKDGKVVTAGGRVLCATALGNSVTEAQQKAYELLKTIQFKDVYFRNDIAYRAIAREANAQ